MNGLEETNLDNILVKVQNLKPIAEKIGCTLAQLALLWCVKNPNVTTVITGASKVSQVVENFKALEFLPQVTDGIMEEIEGVLKNKPTSHRDYRHT